MTARRYESLCEKLVNEPKRWLVTGAAGFIGSALVERLLDLGQSVVGIDNFSTGHRKNLDEVLSINPDQRLQFRMVEGDIADAAVCRKAMRDVDYVLHHAALGSVPRSIEEPVETDRSNVMGFVQVLEAARAAGVTRVVYASSSAVYGDHQGLPKHEPDIGNALSPYAVSKRCNELYGDVFARCYGQQVVGLRYFNVFGRRQDPQGAYAAVIPKWIHLLLAGRRCPVFGDGQASRDFCYVDNVVQANILAATHEFGPGHHRVFNVGCAEKTALLELHRLIRDELARVRPELVEFEPEFHEVRPGDIVHSLASIERIHQELGYVPTHTVAQGMAETVAWFAAKSAER